MLHKLNGLLIFITEFLRKQNPEACSKEWNWNKSSKKIESLHFWGGVSLCSIQGATVSGNYGAGILE
jgi:hypothetical protein